MDPVKRLLAFLLLMSACSVALAQSIAFVQLIPSWNLSYGPPSGPTFTPGAGDLILVAATDIVNQNQTITFSGTGTYSVLTPPGQFNQTNDGGAWALAYNSNATAVSQTVNGQDTGWEGYVAGFAIDYSGGGGATVAAAYTETDSPGTGAGGAKGTAVTVPTGSILVALATQLTVGGGSNTGPAVAAGGTSRGAGQTTGGSGYPNLWYAWAEWAGTGATITPEFTATDDGTHTILVTQWLLTPGSGGITHACWTNTGAITVPTAGATQCLLKSGTFSTVDGSTVEYWQPLLGTFGVN